MASNMADDEEDDDDLFTLKPKSLKKAKEPNPFSFKEFLSSESLLPSELPAIVAETLLPDINLNTSKRAEANPYSFKQFIQSPDIPADIGLPSVSPAKTTSLELLLPDCVTETADEDFKSPQVAKKKLLVADDQDIDELPALDDLPNLDGSRDRDRDIELENRALREQIESNRRALADQATLIKKLEKQIKTLRDREESENKTLEMMVQQVEQNLVKTTERAVKSEQHAETLKGEIKALKAHILTLSAENAQLKVLKSAAANGESQQRRLEEYAGQLEMASNTAETSLKQLLGGLESLRLISASLKTFGKITEVSSD